MASLINRDPKLLHPALLLRVQRGLALARQKGLVAAVFEGHRTPERQLELYNIGRTTAGRAITNAGPWQSWHNYGLAVDLVFDGELSKPGMQWSWAGDYKALSKIMKEQGLRWSGSWNILTGRLSGELCHYELTAGLTLREVQALHSKGGMPLVWTEISKRVG